MNVWMTGVPDGDVLTYPLLKKSSPYETDSIHWINTHCTKYSHVL